MKDSELQTRRRFCIQACETASLMALGGVLGTILEGCSSNDPVSSAPDLPTIQAAVVSGSITLTIDASSPLATVGNAALVQYGSGSMLVARTTQSAFAAVTAICTHQSCTITGYENQVYTCPCHGSQFGVSGNVIKGPAASSLRSYQTQFAGNQLTISLS
jgi:cytochrome b6-f complex iron-sulfur subunit